MEITPLGAAVVEALPDRDRVRRIKRRFRESGTCPTSRVFDADAVRSFYASRGQLVKAVDPGLRRSGRGRRS